MSKIGFVMVMNGFFMAVALGGHGILGGKSEGLWFAKNRRETRCHTWLFLPALFIAAFVTAQPTMGDRFGGLCFGLCFVSFSFLSACVRLSLQMMIMTVKILRMKNATKNKNKNKNKTKNKNKKTKPNQSRREMTAWMLRAQPTTITTTECLKARTEWAVSALSCHFWMLEMNFRATHAEPELLQLLCAALFFKRFVLVKLRKPWPRHSLLVCRCHGHADAPVRRVQLRTQSRPHP